MAKKKQDKQGRQADEEVRTALPPGVKLLRTLEGHQKWVYCVAFDPQDGVLAAASYDSTVYLWETKSGKLITTLKHQAGVESVAFDSRGGRLASGSDDKTVKLWEARSGKLLRTLEGHQSGVRALGYSGPRKLDHRLSY